MKVNLLIGMLLIIWAITSCQQYTEENINGETAAEEIVLEDVESTSTAKSIEIVTADETNSPVINILQSKKIIRQGSISIETKNNKITKANLDKLLKASGGYYESENMSNGTSYSNYNLIVRIPSSQFDHFLQSLDNGPDKITERTISAEDISLKYLDIESRLKSKRAYLQRYQQIVSSAKSTKDLLEIEEQIRQLQEDIESNTATLRSWSDQINYSTLAIQIYYAESGNINQPNSFFQDAGEALKTGWKLIERFMLNIIIAWPLLIVIIGLLLGWRKYKQKRKTKTQN